MVKFETMHFQNQCFLRLCCSRSCCNGLFKNQGLLLNTPFLTFQYTNFTPDLRQVYKYLHCFIIQNNFYCIQNSTFIWKKVCTIVYKVYTNGYFDLTLVDKLQRCLDFSVYKFLLWFDLKKCRQSATMICRQKEMYTKVDTPKFYFWMDFLCFLRLETRK